MIANVLSVIQSVVSALGEFLSPTASAGEGSLVTAAAVAAIGTLFAVPIALKAGRKAFGLIKSIGK